MSEEIDYAARVARGVALMDVKWPNWAAEIDLGELDIENGRRCMTAQYAQRHDLGDNWWEAVKPLGLKDQGGGSDYEAHGFNAARAGTDHDADSVAYGTLNGLWKAEIERRRAQAQDAPAEPGA